MERQKRLDCEGYRARHLHLPESVFGPMFFFQKSTQCNDAKSYSKKSQVLLGLGDVFQPLGGIDYFFHCYPF